jgi:hypothetical protein
MDLGHLFIDTITYSSPASFSDGDMTQSAQATATGRWEERYSVTTMSGGEQRATTHNFATTTAIPLESLVWGPGSDTTDQGDALRILARNFAKTLDGSYSYYIYALGK